MTLLLLRQLGLGLGIVTCILPPMGAVLSNITAASYTQNLYLRQAICHMHNFASWSSPFQPP